MSSATCGSSTCAGTPAPPVSCDARRPATSSSPAAATPSPSPSASNTPPTPGQPASITATSATTSPAKTNSPSSPKPASTTAMGRAHPQRGRRLDQPARRHLWEVHAHRQRPGRPLFRQLPWCSRPTGTPGATTSRPSQVEHNMRRMIDTYNPKPPEGSATNANSWMTQPDQLVQQTQAQGSARWIASRIRWTTAGGRSIARSPSSSSTSTPIQPPCRARCPRSSRLRPPPTSASTKWVVGPPSRSPL